MTTLLRSVENRIVVEDTEWPSVVLILWEEIRRGPGISSEKAQSMWVRRRDVFPTRVELDYLTFRDKGLELRAYNPDIECYRSAGCWGELPDLTQVKLARLEDGHYIPYDPQADRFLPLQVEPQVVMVTLTPTAFWYQPEIQAYVRQHPMVQHLSVSEGDRVRLVWKPTREALLKIRQQDHSTFGLFMGEFHQYVSPQVLWIEPTMYDPLGLRSQITSSQLLTSPVVQDTEP